MMGPSPNPNPKLENKTKQRGGKVEEEEEEEEDRRERPPEAVDINSGGWELRDSRFRWMASPRKIQRDGWPPQRSRGGTKMSVDVIENRNLTPTVQRKKNMWPGPPRGKRYRRCECKWKPCSILFGLVLFVCFFSRMMVRWRVCWIGRAKQKQNGVKRSPFGVHFVSIVCHHLCSSLLSRAELQ